MKIVRQIYLYHSVKPRGKVLVSKLNILNNRTINKKIHDSYFARKTLKFIER